MAESTEPTVFVVDDDAAVRNSMRKLISSVGLQVETFKSAQDFLDSYDPSRPGCAVMDVRMPHMSGLELQRRLAEEGHETPIIVITAYGDVPMAVRSMKAGAVDFIEKPVQPQELLDVIQQALKCDAERRAVQAERRDIEARLARLTRREREVMELVVEGHTSRQIAARLTLSTKTVQFYRAEAMGKMAAGSVAELARLVVTARVRSERT